jgi:hypothetical protein
LPNEHIIGQPFIDYKSGRKYVGQQYWRKLDEVYSGYFNHRESKFDGNIGQLNRKLILINNIIHIGKENSSLELDCILGSNNLNGDVIAELHKGDTGALVPSCHISFIHVIRNVILVY